MVTTQITPELKSKLTYRYYDYDNKTPELLFPDWVADRRQTAPTSTTATYAPVNSLSISYNKQNAGADLVWSPTRQWNIGAGYGYERYKWTRADADVTQREFRQGLRRLQALVLAHGARQLGRFRPAL